MIIGDGRKYLSALITLKTNLKGPEDEATTELSDEAKLFIKTTFSLEISTTEEVMRTKAIMDYLQQCMDDTNKFSVSRATIVQKLRVLPVEFTITGGELTPTMKLKRKFVESKFKAKFDQIYEDQKL